MSWLLSENLWRSKAWPRTDRTKIFIGDAVMTAGKAMFREWDGRESDVVAKLNRVKADDVRLLARGAIRNGEDPEEFRGANALRESRLIRVIDWIIERAINGNFDTYLRQPTGGQLLQVEPTVWNTESALKIFSDTRMKYRGKWWNPSAPTVDAYVFFDRAAFEREVEKLVGAPLKVSETDLSALPGPLRLAVKLALDRPDVRGLTQPMRAKIVATRWAELYPGIKSRKYEDAIVAVLGEPDVERIRRGKAKAKT